VTRHSGDLEKAAGPSVETENDRVATVRALLAKQPLMSQYLKNPDVTTAASKAQFTDPEPRSTECPGHQCENNGPDDTTANDTNSSAECDIPIHRPTFPEAPQMTNSPPAVAPHHPTTTPLSAIITYSPNSPTVHSDISNPATPKPIAAGGSRDLPVPDANYPSKSRNERGEGPSPKEPHQIDSTGGTTHRRWKACCRRYGKKH